MISFANLMAGLSDIVEGAIGAERYSGDTEGEEIYSLTHKMISDVSISRSGSMLLYQVV